MLPYARQSVDDEDIRAVTEVLRSDWLTTGPLVEAFEGALAEFVGVKSAVAVSSGTAALHAAMSAVGVGPGDEVIVPAMTFVATANSVVYQGGTPVFADVNGETLLVDHAEVRRRITPRTKAIVTVDYAGQPSDYDSLRALAEEHDLVLIADACHALGAEYRGEKVGGLADVTVFSFHPVKHITTGEGGMVVTDSPALAKKARGFRNHGLSATHKERSRRGTWHNEMVDLGYNYRITDFQCALGLSQLRNLPSWIRRRNAIAERYNQSFEDVVAVEPLRVSPDVHHAYHLYVIRLAVEELGADRAAIFSDLRAEGIGVNVHYLPVHLHPYYINNYETRRGDCPRAEDAYERILTLPLYPAMSDEDVGIVASIVRRVVERAG